MSPKATRLAGHALVFEYYSQFDVVGGLRCECGQKPCYSSRGPGRRRDFARDWHRAHKAAVVALGKTQEAGK